MAKRKKTSRAQSKSKKPAARKVARKIPSKKPAPKAAKTSAPKSSTRKRVALIGGGLAGAIAGTLARQAVRSAARSIVRSVAKSLEKPAKPAASAPRKGKWVYSFGDGRAEGKANMRELLGGKGAGLAEMANLGLPVPPGFTITTEVCTYYYANGQQYPKDLEAQVNKALAQVGKITGKVFGDKSNPLLVSVRSGARAAMPGMMDTVLNLGLNDETVEALAK